MGGEEDLRGHTWVPVDLEPFLNGTCVRPAPAIGLARSDGLRLIYAGREHAVIGEMESGKSWVCAACATAELTAGRRVIYVHFEEGDPADTVDRLILLGVPAQHVRQLFHFVGPNESITPTKRDTLTKLEPSLVIFDGVNEAMSIHGMRIREEEGAALYRNVLVKPFTAVGAAVLSADHVVKDREKRGRDALGSIHKGNGLTGSLILLENVAPFGRGERGASHVFVTKDRPGYLRRHGKPSGLPGKTYMGTLVVDDTRQWAPVLDLAFLAPSEPATTEHDDNGATTGRDADDVEILGVVAKLTATGNAANVRAVRAQAALGKDRVSDALERLLARGALRKGRGARGSRVFTVAGHRG